jgi:hypothetical protein
MSDPGPSGSSAVALFFGWMLIVVGGLIGGLCGLCTLVFIGAGVFSSATTGADASLDVILALVIGGLPTAIGAGIVFAGITVVRGTRAPRATPPEPPSVRP